MTLRPRFGHLRGQHTGLDLIRTPILARTSRICHVLRMRYPAKVIRAIICPIAVNMVTLTTLRTLAMKCAGYQAMDLD
jgi:hypothetical protein